jgi:hypothetical protein
MDALECIEGILAEFHPRGEIANQEPDALSAERILQNARQLAIAIGYPGLTPIMLSDSVT